MRVRSGCFMLPVILSLTMHTAAAEPIRLSVVSQVFSDEGRSLDVVLACVDWRRSDAKR